MKHIAKIWSHWSHFFKKIDGVQSSIKKKCLNPNLGLTTKARGCKVVGQEKDLGVTSHAPKSAKSVRE
jgi:hypothetical protein